MDDNNNVSNNVSNVSHSNKYQEIKRERELMKKKLQESELKIEAKELKRRIYFQEEPRQWRPTYCMELTGGDNIYHYRRHSPPETKLRK